MSQAGRVGQNPTSEIWGRVEKLSPNKEWLGLTRTTITEYTVMYGAYIRFWPTLVMAQPNLTQLQCVQGTAHFTAQLIQLQCVQGTAHFAAQLIQLQCVQGTAHFAAQLIQLQCVQGTAHFAAQLIQLQCVQGTAHLAAQLIQLQCVQGTGYSPLCCTHPACKRQKGSSPEPVTRVGQNRMYTLHMTVNLIKITIYIRSYTAYIYGFGRP